MSAQSFSVVWSSVEYWRLKRPTWEQSDLHLLHILFLQCVSVPTVFTQDWSKFSKCVSVWAGSQWKGSKRESLRWRKQETDRVHICFGSRVCSDGFLCQHSPNGAELNCKVKRAKMEAEEAGWGVHIEELAERMERRRATVCEGVNERERGSNFYEPEQRQDRKQSFLKWWARVTLLDVLRGCVYFCVCLCWHMGACVEQSVAAVTTHLSCLTTNTHTQSHTNKHISFLGCTSLLAPWPNFSFSFNSHLTFIYVSSSSTLVLFAFFAFIYFIMSVFIVKSAIKKC